MSQQIYNFIKFLEKKEGRNPPAMAVVRYGSDEEKKDEEIQLAAVKEDKNLIKYIKNPTEPVQLAAVEQEGYLIQFIDNPTEPVQLAAVKKNPHSIQHIYEKGIEPTPKVKKVAYYAFMRKYGKIPNGWNRYFD
jgi:hypothetical protein